MIIKLKDETLSSVLSDIEKHGFACDGCACGEWGYQLDTKLFVLFYRNCRKANATPDEKLWHIEDPVFYEGGEWEFETYNDKTYRYRFNQVGKELDNYKINNAQFEIIISKLKEVSKKSWGNEYRNEY